MNTVENTDLTYTEADSICLQYYLGDHCETMNEWAQRVWKNCDRWKKGLKITEDGNKLARVYSRDPFELWEEKKRRRRAAMMKEKIGCNCPDELLKHENIKKDLERGCRCKWPLELSDERIIAIRDDPKHNYKTATKRNKEEAEEMEKAEKKEKEKKKLELRTLLKGNITRDVINILRPDLIGLDGVEIVPNKGKK